MNCPWNNGAEFEQKHPLSLDEPPEEELARIWLTEAKRRARELDRGAVQPIAVEEVRRKARALLR